MLISSSHNLNLCSNSQDTRFLWNVFEAVQKTRSTYFIGSKTVGAIFFLSFCFSFSHLLVIVYSFFTLRYFVYYAPLLCAVCKFRYSLLPRPYFIASFYGAISVTTFVEVGSFFGGPDHQPCLPQHLVSSFVFIVFSFIVWDFPTLCQERRYSSLYLFVCDKV